MLKLFGKKVAEKRLDAVLEGRKPPSFSKSVMNVLRILRDEESSIDDVADVLQWDPGLVARVLGTVNSAAYAPLSPIRDVRHAVSFMGRTQLEQLVLAVAVKEALPSSPARGFDPDRYWRAASRRAALARTFAEELHPAHHAESFTIGLLEDLAVPVLAQARPDTYGGVLETWNREPQTPLQELEREVLGFDHSEVGSLLGARWELPASLVHAVGHHHDGGRDEVLPAVRLVSMLAGSEADGVEAMVEEGRASYGLDADWMIGAVESSETQAEELVQALA